MDARPRRPAVHRGIPLSPTGDYATLSRGDSRGIISMFESGPGVASTTTALPGTTRAGAAPATLRPGMEMRKPRTGPLRRPLASRGVAGRSRPAGSVNRATRRRIPGSQGGTLPVASRPMPSRHGGNVGSRGSGRITSRGGKPSNGGRMRTRRGCRGQLHVSRGSTGEPRVLENTSPREDGGIPRRRPPHPSARASGVKSAKRGSRKGSRREGLDSPQNVISGSSAPRPESHFIANPSDVTCKAHSFARPDCESAADTSNDSLEVHAQSPPDAGESLPMFDGETQGIPPRPDVEHLPLETRLPSIDLGLPPPIPTVPLPEEEEVEAPDPSIQMHEAMYQGRGGEGSRTADIAGYARSSPVQQGVQRLPSLDLGLPPPIPDPNSERAANLDSSLGPLRKSATDEGLPKFNGTHSTSWVKAPPRPPRSGRTKSLLAGAAMGSARSMTAVIAADTPPPKRPPPTPIGTTAGADSAMSSEQSGPKRMSPSSEERNSPPPSPRMDSNSTSLGGHEFKKRGMSFLSETNPDLAAAIEEARAIAAQTSSPHSSNGDGTHERADGSTSDTSDVEAEGPSSPRSRTDSTLNSSTESAVPAIVLRNPDGRPKNMMEEHRGSLLTDITKELQGAGGFWDSMRGKDKVQLLHAMQNEHLESETVDADAVRKSRKSLALVLNTASDGDDSAAADVSAPLAEADKLDYSSFDDAEVVSLFAEKPHKAIALAVSKGIVSDNPSSKAWFVYSLLRDDKLDKVAAGEYLGGLEQLSVLSSFRTLFDFEFYDLDLALRKFLYFFRLPKEAQQIDRVIQAFADQFSEDNSKHFGDSEVVYILSYSVIMLNTDQHNPLVKRRMTRDDFIKNHDTIQGKDGQKLSSRLLGALFDRVSWSEIQLDCDDAVYPNVVKNSWVRLGVERSSDHKKKNKSKKEKKKSKVAVVGARVIEWSRYWMRLVDTGLGYALYCFCAVDDPRPYRMMQLKGASTRSMNFTVKDQKKFGHNRLSYIKLAFPDAVTGMRTADQHVYIAFTEVAQRKDWVETLQAYIERSGSG